MNWLEEQLRHTSPPDLILHLGAGNCRELSHWLKAGARQIVLVEPNPELFPDLRSRVDGLDSVEIITEAIASEPGRAALRLFNFYSLSSLREPTGLYQSLPGLRQIGRAMVETITVDQLLEPLDLRPNGEHWLVIDIPGDEAAILDQLEHCGRLQDFSRIILTAGAEALYTGAETAAALVKRLEDRGYNAIGRPDDSDGDWPRYHLTLNRLALDFRQVCQQLEQAEDLSRRESDRADALAAERQTLEAALAEAKQAHEQAAKAAQTFEAALTEQKTISEKLGTELHERKKDIARLTQACDEAQRKLAEAEQMMAGLPEQQHRLELLEQENGSLHAQLESKATEAADSTAKLQAQIEQQTRESQTLKIRVSQLEEENEDYQERHKLLEEELIKAEAQIELIKQLFLTGDDALDFDDNEPEKS